MERPHPRTSAPGQDLVWIYRLYGLISIHYGVDRADSKSVTAPTRFRMLKVNRLLSKMCPWMKLYCGLLYFRPLVLKNFFSGRSLRARHSFSSSAVGTPSLMCRVVNAAPWLSSHFRAFWQVVHFGYSTNSILISPLPTY